MFSKKEFIAMAKVEPNLTAPTDTVDTIDVKHALAVLRSENARLKDQAATNAKTAAQNEETHKKNYEGWRRENLKLQEQLLAPQERVYELQGKLLSLREIVNGA
jgi:hypothetical protein